MALEKLTLLDWNVRMLLVGAGVALIGYVCLSEMGSSS